MQSGNVITGGGISSGIDEALYIISVAVNPDAARRAQLSMQYHPQPIVHCGDPAEPDIRDIPELPASIQNDWDVAGTLRQVQNWLATRDISDTFKLLICLLRLLRNVSKITAFNLT